MSPTVLSGAVQNSGWYASVLFHLAERRRYLSEPAEHRGGSAGLVAGDEQRLRPFEVIKRRKRHFEITGTEVADHTNVAREAGM